MGIQKAITAGVGAVAAILVYFIGLDASFSEAMVGLVPPIFGVIQVFSTENSSATDWSKAAEALEAAALTVVGYFIVLDPGAGQMLALVLGGVVTVVGVWFFPNSGGDPARRATPRDAASEYRGR